MALIQNDIGPVSARGVLGFAIVAIVIAAAAFVLYKQYRRVFHPAPVDAIACKKDQNYHYKDPANHPNDC